MKKKIKVEGLEIAIEQIRDKDYISLTDIARKFNDKPSNLLVSWIKNGSTLLFLEAWEIMHNPDFKRQQMVEFKARSIDHRSNISLRSFITETGAIGIISKSGRYGGTYAHRDIALNFCYWISPPFQVAMIIKFQKLLEEEFQRKNLEWHISKITDNIDEVRNLLDTIPYQKPERNRLKGGEDEEGSERGWFAATPQKQTTTPPASKPAGQCYGGKKTTPPLS